MKETIKKAAIGTVIFGLGFMAGVTALSVDLIRLARLNPDAFDTLLSDLKN